MEFVTYLETSKKSRDFLKYRSHIYSAFGPHYNGVGKLHIPLGFISLEYEEIKHFLNAVHQTHYTLSYPSFFVHLLSYTANVNRQTADNLSFSYAVITGENV